MFGRLFGERDVHQLGAKPPTSIEIQIIAKNPPKPMKDNASDTAKGRASRHTHSAATHANTRSGGTSHVTQYIAVGPGSPGRRWFVGTGDSSGTSSACCSATTAGPRQKNATHAPTSRPNGT